MESRQTVECNKYLIFLWKILRSKVIAEYLQKNDAKSNGAKRDWSAIYDECASVSYQVAIGEGPACGIVSQDLMPKFAEVVVDSQKEIATTEVFDVPDDSRDLIPTDLIVSTLPDEIASETAVMVLDLQNNTDAVTPMKRGPIGIVTDTAGKVPMKAIKIEKE